MILYILGLYLSLSYGATVYGMDYIWYPIPGSVRELTTNSQELWGIGTDNRLYRCMLPCDGQMNSWMPVQSLQVPLKKISLSETEAWGVTPAGEIYRCSLPCEHPMDWARVSGILSNIRISRRKAFGTDQQGHVYKANMQSTRYYPNVRWHQVPGTKMKSVSFKGQDIWGVDGMYRLYRFEPQLRFWMRQPGKMQSITVGKRYLYGLQVGTKILMRCLLPCLEADWENTNKRFERIVAGPKEESTIYAIAPGGKIFMGFESSTSCHYERSPRLPFNRYSYTIDRNYY